MLLWMVPLSGLERLLQVLLLRLLRLSQPVPLQHRSALGSPTRASLLQQRREALLLARGEAEAGWAQPLRLRDLQQRCRLCRLVAQQQATHLLLHRRSRRQQQKPNQLKQQRLVARLLLPWQGEFLLRQLQQLPHALQAGGLRLLQLTADCCPPQRRQRLSGDGPPEGPQAVAPLGRVLCAQRLFPPSARARLPAAAAAAADTAAVATSAAAPAAADDRAAATETAAGERASAETPAAALRLLSV